MDRRSFLHLITLAGLYAALPANAWASPLRRRLVLIELKGGNDGLNTLVPYSQAAYYQARSNIAIPANTVLPLSHEWGMHPALTALMPAWTAGDLAWVHGLGYDQPNRSHFRSIDIWETASRANQVLDAGWMTQITRTAAVRPGKDWPDALVLGSRGGPLEGGKLRLLRLTAPATPDLSLLPEQRPVPADHEALRHILAVQGDYQETRQVLQKLYHEKNPYAERLKAFSKKPLDRQLALAADLIVRGAPVPVFKLDLAGFDTHVNQVSRHATLLRQLGDGLAHFREVLMAASQWDNTLVVTYSEFGRRVAENASGGTDHGTASAHIMFGGSVRGGFFGQPPSLTDLVASDLVHTLDFQRWYAAIVSQWFDASTPQAWGAPAFDWLRRAVV